MLWYSPTFTCLGTHTLLPNLDNILKMVTGQDLQNHHRDICQPYLGHSIHLKAFTRCDILKDQFKVNKHKAAVHTVKKSPSDVDANRLAYFSPKK